MGLGAPKRRNKLSHDPNNTAWTRATDNFGHKILSRQGWTPGSYLGATNASHADHYTAANASHIRVLLREDNLGLGAQVGKTNAETFGLSLFSGVLGRLNGKSDGEVQKQQDAFRDLELRTYQERKYGVVGFVSGGFLVGDRIRRTKEEEEADEAKCPVKEERKSLKREADDDVEVEKPSKKIKPSQGDEVTIKSEQQSETDSAVTKPRTEKRRKKKNKDHNKSKSATSDGLTEDADTDNQDERATKRKAKEEKRAHKEVRRRRKAEKALRRLKKEQEAAAESESDSSSSKSPTDHVVSRPNSTTPAMGGRQAVRHRYIQQKRMASMDAQAMKEIFMMKAAG